MLSFWDFFSIISTEVRKIAAASSIVAEEAAIWISCRSSFNENGPLRFFAILFLGLEPEFDQAADGFGARGSVVLASGPRIEGSHKLVGKAKCARRVRPGCWTTGARPPSAYLFSYCIFHI
jgi:hypothetical protein